MQTAHLFVVGCLLVLMAGPPAASNAEAGDAVATTTTMAPATTGLNQPLTLTATVTPSDATGSVSFNLAGGFNAPVSGGQAVLTLSAWPVGTYQVTAEYLGDATHLGSQSAPV